MKKGTSATGNFFQTPEPCTQEVLQKRCYFRHSWRWLSSSRNPKTSQSMCLSSWGRIWMGNLPLFIQFYILTWSSLNWGICYNRRQCIFKMWFVVGKLKSSYVITKQSWWQCALRCVCKCTLFIAALSAPRDCVCTSRINCLMWKRIASKALSFIAKFMWFLKNNQEKQLLQLFWSHYCSSALTISLWLRFCNDLSSSWPSGLPVSWGYLLVFPCPIPSTDTLLKKLDSLLQQFPAVCRCVMWTKYGKTERRQKLRLSCPQQV